MSGLTAELVVRRPGFALELELDVAPGEVVALLGPNGAGKTTALRALAGLQGLTAGRVRLGESDLTDRPPEARQVGLVPQDGLLLPHLSARDNVAYGLRARGTRRAEAHRRAAEELARVGLADRAAARPRTLSGGQAQRVALARALVVEPALLLLDEPLAALDALTRTAVRTDLAARLHAFGGPVVLVTHDLVDALVLADRLVVLEAGEVVQEGPPSDVVRRPQTDYVAGLAGLVLLRGSASRGGVVVDGTRLEVPTDVEGPALVAFPPHAVTLGTEPAPGSWPVAVRALEQQGATTRVLLDGPPGTALVPTVRLPELGARLHAGVRLEDVEVYASSRPRSRRSLAT